MKTTGRGCRPTSGAEDELDQDFLFYLAHTKWCLTMLPKEFHKQAGKWLKVLLGMKPRTAAMKKERNLHLSSLLLDMTFGKLREMYADSLPPKPGEPLPPHPTAPYVADEEAVRAPEPHVQHRGSNPIPDWVQKLMDGSELKPEDVNYEPEVTHKDGRIDLSTEAPPEHPPGACGFLSMSTERKRVGPEDVGGRGHASIHVDGEEVDGDRNKCCDELNRRQRQQEGDSKTTQTIAAELLAQRRPPEAREALNRTSLENLVAQVERAMKGEKIKRIEMLLEQLEEEMRTDSTYDLLWELPKDAVRGELLRSLLDAIVLEKGKMAPREKCLRRIEGNIPPLFTTSTQPHCTRNRNTRYQTEPIYPYGNQTASQIRCAKARNFNQGVACAKEDLETYEDSNQTLNSLKEEMMLDMKSAEARNQGTRLTRDITMEAADKLRQELYRENEDPRRHCPLAYQQEMLQARRSSYSQAIYEGFQNLYSIKRQIRDIKTPSRRELISLDCKLRSKLRQVSHLLKMYEVLGLSWESGDSYGPGDECFYDVNYFGDS